ncbi:MAG: hypothetical protein HPZ91_05550, partial [Lentisphaeria bacterium]|nr:hypothetical protein [Lentisphaeria bacterium]
SSIIFNRNWWNVPGWFSASQGTPKPGSYSISASPTDNKKKSDSGSMTVIGIDRVEHIAASDVSFFKTLSDADTDYLVCIETGNSLQLKAYPDGGPTWPKDRPVWSSGGAWLFLNYVAKKAGSNDVTTVDTGKDGDNITVTVSCGTSSKTVAVRTFKYKFRLNVKKASNSEPINIGPWDTFNGFRSVGHAWWKVEVTNSEINLDDIGLPDYKNADYIGVNVGYYPTQSTLPPNFSASGKLEVKDNGSAEKYVEKELTRAEFEKVAKYTKDERTSPGTYVLAQRVDFIKVWGPTQVTLNMLGYGNRIFTGANYTMSGEKNCVTVAKGAAAKAGISIGNTLTDGKYDEAGIDYYFKGNTPLALFNAM